jgi:hypothetical protein
MARKTASALALLGGWLATVMSATAQAATEDLTTVAERSGYQRTCCG